MAGNEGEPMEVNLTVGLTEVVENQCSKIREHAETYPCLWGSYILVYGGLGAYFTFQWRKLRQTENRVRVLHRRLRNLHLLQDMTVLVRSGLDLVDD